MRIFEIVFVLIFIKKIKSEKRNEQIYRNSVSNYIQSPCNLPLNAVFIGKYFHIELNLNF
jgi:hypothetical protein